jgi:superfamily I DNA and/or RNA helicase
MGIIGFLSDYRRLNVAMTRAKKKLVIIGDGATLSSNELYLNLINHVEKEGLLESAWEYMM